MPIVGKPIAAAVGRQGGNFFLDVNVVKYLLNTVPEADGGPLGVVLQSTPLDELIAHIERFQQTDLGVSDGRVDPEGRTLRALCEFDPTPDDLPFVPALAFGRKGGKRG